MLCPKAFYEGNGLRGHIRSFHEKIKPFRCKICNKSFGERSTFKGHMSCVHAGTDISF